MLSDAEEAAPAGFTAEKAGLQLRESIDWRQLALSNSPWAERLWSLPCIGCAIAQGVLFLSLQLSNRMKFYPRSIRALAGFVAASALLTSAGLAQTSLVHRYSFNDPTTSTTIADSVGGASWAGTLQGSAALDGSQLQLDGNGWVTLPAGLVHSYNQVTVEFWASFSPNNGFWTRVYAFGDQNGSAENTGVDFCHYAGGDWQNLNLQNSTSGVYANNPGGLNGQTNVHVTMVMDPLGNKMYYYNGTKLTSDPVLNNGAGGTVPPLSTVNDIICLIGKSLYDVDPLLQGSINEFRIYSGVMSSSTLALNDAAGPDNIITNPGPVQTLHFSSPINPLRINQRSQQVLTGDFTNLTGLNLILYGGATFSTLNPGVVTIDTNGVVKAVGAGTGQVVATFEGLKATNTLTVVALPPVLAHRYSFTTDASDSIGGANGTLMGNATVSGGQVVLDGSFGTYVDLPAGQINIATNTAVTFDAWVTFNNPATWAYLFGFGNTNGGNGQNQIGCIPSAENGGVRHWGITENFGTKRTTAWAHSWNNMTAHITCVVDPPTGAISIYRNGVLEFAEYDAVSPISGIETNYGFLGRSFYDADPYLTASIDEFRIYSGALTPEQVELNDLQGPGATNLDVGALSSIVVVATNYPAFASAVPPVILANYAHLTNFNLVATLTAGGNSTLTGPQGLVITSSDTNIVSVAAGNLLTTHRSGTVTLSATYQGKSSSATIRVHNSSTLAHRYSFTTDASDSVGGADGTLQGGATVSGGQLQLTGASTDYLELPGGLLLDYDSVTIDTWVNFGPAQSWARLWQFTDITLNPPGGINEFFFAPGWNGPPNANVYSAGFPRGGGGTTTGLALGGAPFHITCLYGNGSMEVYTNGVFQGSQSGLIAPASQAGTNFSWIGHSPYPADPGINGSVDEYRIYRGKLSQEEITASDLIGPDQTLTTVAKVTVTKSGANTVLSWPVAAAGFAVESRTNLSSAGSWITLTNAPTLVGTNWQFTVPSSGTAQFIRLVK